MKKLFLLLSLFLCINAQAEEKELSPATLAQALADAKDGDVLLLTSGKYTNPIAFPTRKTITLKAVEAGTVELSGSLSCKDEQATDGGLILDGITINPQNNYFMDLTYGDIKQITIRNCEIKNVYRCFIRTNNTGHSIDAINFDNCTIHDCGKNGWNFLYPNHVVKSVKVENSTLYNYTNGESFFAPRKAYDGDFSFVFNHNTVYNWSKAAKYAICNVDGNKTGKATYEFDNNIFYGGGKDGDRPNILKANGGTLIANNNLVIDYGGYQQKAAISQNINDITLELLGLNSFNFPDPSNGNFQITSANPLATAATDGGVVGAPKWLKQITAVAHLTTTVSPSEAGTAVPAKADYEKGETVTVSATNNYGYRFKEWRDGNGKVLSTEASFQYKIENDITLTAVFTALNTYTLSIRKEGEGARFGEVTFEPEPTDGKYEEGTTVIATVIPNKVSSFLYWEDQTSENKRTITMNGDKTIKATFDVVPFITGWNFKNNEPRNARPGDFYAETDNTGLLSLYNADGSQSSWGASIRNFSGRSLSCIRRYTGVGDMDNPRSFVASFNLGTHKKVSVHFLAAADNNCVHNIQKLQISTDGANYSDLKTFKMTELNKWMEIDVEIPADITPSSTIYLRWIGDTASGLLGSVTSKDTEGFYLAEVIIFGEEDSGSDTKAPTLLSTSPAKDSQTASASGNIVLMFDKKIKRGHGEATLNGKTLDAMFGSKTVSFAYANLNYGQECTFVVPAGAITDKNGNAFEGTTIKFNIMERPRPTAKTFDAIVAQDGTGDYKTVQAAINAAPENLAYPYLIFVKNGIYDELVTVSGNKTNLHLIGQDKENTIIKHRIVCGDEHDPASTNNPNSPNYKRHAVVEVGGANFYTENISYVNSFGVDEQSGPMALAMRSNGDRLAFYNCKFRSYQDTWETSTHLENDSHYIKDCHIEGAVDYFYGGGNAFLDHCTLYNVRAGAVIVAPCHRDATYGYVFNNCVIDGNELAKNSTVALGRPWHNSPKTVYINTIAKIKISPSGWNNMGAIPALFAEYNTVDANGNPVDLSNRRTTYTYKENGEEKSGSCKAVLDADEVAAYSYENVVSSGDHWNPRTLMEPVDAPKNIILDKTSGKLTWVPSEYAICYIVFDVNDKVLTVTKESSYTAGNDEVASYIKAVNENGSLSGKYPVTITTDNAKITATDRDMAMEYYTVTGMKMGQMRKGLNIVKTIDKSGAIKTYKIIR